MTRTLPNVLTESQMITLARLPDRATLQGQRDRAILGMLCATGLRATELCHVQVRDVAPTRVFVRRGKAGTQRYVPLSRRCYRAIQTYLAAQPARPDEPLFRRIEGGALDRRLLHKIVATHEKRLGLTTGVHILRSSAATRWLNAGLSIRHCQAALGHEQVTTTARYLKVSTHALVRAFQACLEPAGPAGDAR